MKIVGGVLGVGMLYSAWYAFFNTPWETPLRRALFSASCLALAFSFIAYAISNTYGKRRAAKAPTIRFKDPQI